MNEHRFDTLDKSLQLAYAQCPTAHACLMPYLHDQCSLERALTALALAYREQNTVLMRERLRMVQDAPAKMVVMPGATIQQERERCARLVEQMNMQDPAQYPYADGVSLAGQAIAKRIRSGEP